MSAANTERKRARNRAARKLRAWLREQGWERRGNTWTKGPLTISRGPVNVQGHPIPVWKLQRTDEHGGTRFFVDELADCAPMVIGAEEVAW